MPFRDDRDALRDRVDGLERDLSDAERRLAEKDDSLRRADGLAAELAQAKSQLERIERELSARRPRTGSPAGPVLIVALAVLAVGASLFLFLGRPSPVTPPPSLPPVAPATAAPLPMPSPTPAPSPAPVPAPVVQPRLTATATWTAKVQKATGGLPAGARCKVTAELASRGGKMGKPEVVVTCGSKAIYDSAVPLNGMSNSAWDTTESAGPRPGTHRYAMMLEDKGTRSGERAEIVLDTAHRAAVVWHDSIPAYRVELVVDELSAPVEGPALAGP